MITTIRTDSDNPDFQSLVVALDLDLKIRDGEEHAFYAQYNKTAAIKHVIVAYHNEVPVGIGAIKQYTQDTMEVKRMYVVPAFRGQGIASMVLQALEKWCKEMHYKTCVLETGKKQPEAIALYTKSGYQVIANYGQYENVENSICFKKELGQ